MSSFFRSHGDESDSADSNHARSETRVAADFLNTTFFGLLFVAVGILAGLAFYNISHSNQVYEGVSLAGVDISGMTRTEARAEVIDIIDSYENQPVILASMDKEFQVVPAEAGIVIDLNETIDSAYRYGRDGSIWNRSIDWAQAIIHGHDVPLIVDVDQPSVDATLASIAPEVTRAPKDAFIEISESGDLLIIPELPGYTFDVTATTEALVRRTAALSSQPVTIVSPLVDADVAVADLEVGFDQVQAAVDSPLVVQGFDRFWGIAESDIRSIVTVGGVEQAFEVDADAVSGFVDSIAAESNQESRDAQVVVGDDGLLTAVPAQIGIEVRVDETTQTIVAALASGVHVVDLLYESESPLITDDEALLAATAGEQMLSRGVQLEWEGDPFTVDRSVLLESLTIFVDPDSDEPFTFGLDRSTLEDSIAGIIQSVEQPVIEPQLRLVDGEITIAIEGAPGRVVNAEKTVSNMVKAALEGDGTAELVVEKRNPSRTPSSIEDIYLEDTLAEASTYYGDSSDARRLNVERAADLESGWLIAPGEEFSYARLIGLVDEDNGFVTGFGIVDDGLGGVTTAPVVGGGICQVSTTIFQAAYWSGLNIVERYSHPYWIQAYGEPPRGMQGLDAMVNIEPEGSLDLRFTNTTGNWIAVTVVADGTTVTVKVLGTDTGWNIDVGPPQITSVIKPDLETRFTKSPELPEGQQLQVEFAQEGFTSEVTRVITDENGELVDTAYVISAYAPSQNTILEGTGTTGEATVEAID